MSDRPEVLRRALQVRSKAKSITSAPMPWPSLKWPLCHFPLRDHATYKLAGDLLWPPAGSRQPCGLQLQREQSGYNESYVDDRGCCVAGAQ